MFNSDLVSVHRLEYFKKLQIPLWIHIRIFHKSIFSHRIFICYSFDRLHIFKISIGKICYSEMNWTIICKIIYLGHGPYVFVLNFNGAHFLPICHCHMYLHASPKVLLIEPCGRLFYGIWNLGLFGLIWASFMHFLCFL